MIIFISDGRLGNQAFQYSFLNSISSENELIATVNMSNFVDIFDIDNSNFKNYKAWRIVKFSIKNIIKPYLIPLLTTSRIISYIKQRKNGEIALPEYSFSKGFLPITFVETNFFQSDIFFKENNPGFKISEKYLSEARNAVSEIPSSYTKVFVHVRRGDYLYERFRGSVGIDLPKDYYIKSMEIIQCEIHNPYYIFLSDDPDFVKYCFSEINNKYISYNGMGVDLAIMSMCEYGVTSNSSFSWWGAYLMENRKIICFPQYWYGWKEEIESHVGIQPKWGVTVDWKSD